LPTRKERGTVFVLLGDGTSEANQPPNIGVPGDQSELLASLQDQVRYLREQLDAEREARTEERRRHDTVVAQLTSKIPAIEAPQEASEAAETVEDEPERADPSPGTEGAQTVSERRSVEDPPLLRRYVVGVTLSMLAATFGEFISMTSWPGYSARGGHPGTLTEYVSTGTLILPLLGIPAFCGFWLGRRARSLRFWRHLVPVGILIGLGSVLAMSVLLQAFPSDVVDLVVTVIPGPVYVFAAVLGNAIQRQNRERLMEESPSEFPSESAAAAQGWTPRQQAIVGLAGTIISALIGLIGTILTVMASS